MEVLLILPGWCIPPSGPGQGTLLAGPGQGNLRPGGVPPCGQKDGWTDTCQNITFPRTTYAVGNKVLPFKASVFSWLSHFIIKRCFRVFNLILQFRKTYMSKHSSFRLQISQRKNPKVNSCGTSNGKRYYVSQCISQKCYSLRLWPKLHGRTQR